jgi:hypothetical protein
MTEYGVGMRYRWSMLAIGAAPLLLWAFGHSEGRATSLSLNQDGSTVGTGSVPVVVELFTSEGCSSCPPVIALEEHVDYWNGDGWTDPFSGREWTARQEGYAYTLKNRNPYTPQMVIDGHTELVGNREGAARQAIAVAGTQAKAHVSIAVSPAAKAGSEQAIVSVDPINGTSGGDKSEIWLAVTESGLHSAVNAGENAGADVHHASVVRTLRKIGSIDDNKSSSYSGSTPLHLDSAWKRQNLRIVVFVQARKSRQIVGAAAAPIEQ